MSNVIPKDKVFLCPECGTPCRMVESGAAISSLSSQPTQHLWRWFCPNGDWQSDQWNGYRVFEVKLLEHYYEYDSERTGHERSGT